MFKSGFIGIIGRPNVGKSTLLNSILGEKIAITTSKPQTTRNRIMGIKNVPDGQLIFLDTPGIHKAEKPLNRYMVREATETFESVDIILLIVEAETGAHGDDQMIIDSLKDTSIPVMLLINKIDLVEKTILLPLIDEFSRLFPFREIVPVSATKGNGVSLLLDLIRQTLPEGPQYFPEDTITDRSERFLAAEILREKIILLTRREIPYATAVTIDTFKENEAKNLIRIQATVTVEKPSQKGILIGRKGAMLKEIGTHARLEMEKFFASKIFLEVFVRVEKDWTKSPRLLKELGYSDK